jgi:cellulose synthase/poly-beta-1,6-N-acetylglucosamine synthase-like glycosyltransferase
MAVILFSLSVGLILYTYLGYPLLVTLAARVWQRPLLAQAQTPSVTLLIAAHNEEEMMAQKIENSLALDYPSECLQILVAADGSQDGTAEIVRRYAHKGVMLNYEPARRGKMAAINRAMPKTNGEIVLFSDANNFYEVGTLRTLVSYFADPQVGAVSGAKLIAEGDGTLGHSEGLYWRYESFIKQQETAVDSCVGVAGEVLAIRRHLFEPPPENIINDDFYIAMRLLQRGYRVIYAPEARSIERVSPSAQDEIARRTRIVSGRYQALWHSARLLPWRRPLLVWQIVSHKFLRPLVPLAMISALWANLVLLRRPGKLARLGWVLQVVFYGTAVFGSLFRLPGKIGKLFYLPAFLVHSNLAALVGLYRFLGGKQSARWQRLPRRPMSLTGKEA